MDDIQRKLELIDKQLAGSFANTHKQIISTAPLLFAAIGLIAGILLQCTFDLSVSIWLILLVLFAAATVFFFIIQQFSSINHQLPITNYQYATAYLALACFVCLGAVRLTSFNRPRTNDIRNFVGSERKLATIRGLIVTEPYVDQRRWEFAKFMHTDPASSFYLKLGEVETVDGWMKVAGTIRVRVDEPVLDLKAGDYIQAYCWLDRFKQPTNPGQFNTAKYLARKNVFIAASIKSRDAIGLLESQPKSAFTKVKGRLRETATQALLGGPLPENPSEGLLQALLLGYRRNIDNRTYDAFRKMGLLHFISLSGMHLGILIGAIWWLCKIAGLQKRSRAIICIIAIAIFLLIVPPRAPTLRAAIIGWVFCLSFFFRRRHNSINTLSLAAIILLLIRPTQLFEAGWQLSFASVLGIILFTNRIESFLYERITDSLWIEKILKTKLFFRVPPAVGTHLLKLFSVGLAAWLGGAGILLYHFYTINPLTSIWTAITFLLVVGILIIGFLKIILSFLLPTLALLLGLILTGLAEALIWLVEHIARLDISQILIGHISPAPIIFYYTFIVFVAFVYFRRPLIKKATCAAAVLAIIAFLGAAKWQRTHHNNLVITTLDVGHGQAILAQLPGKANVLFDAGSLYKSDIGRRIVAPFLDYIGINKIDAIVISHNDIDHINGIPEIVEYCKVTNVYANDAFFSQKDQWGTAKSLSDALLEQGHEMKTLDENFDLQSTANIKILWPTKQIALSDELSDNDKSLVSLIEFAGTEILLCSDIEEFAQGQLLQLFPNLKPEVMVVPHHGSAKTINANFLETIGADILICSCSKSRYENQQVIKPDNNAKLFYTPKDGAVTICVDKDGTINARTFVK